MIEEEEEDLLDLVAKLEEEAEALAKSSQDSAQIEPHIEINEDSYASSNEDSRVSEEWLDTKKKGLPIAFFRKAPMRNGITLSKLVWAKNKYFQNTVKPAFFPARKCENSDGAAAKGLKWPLEESECIVEFLSGPNNTFGYLHVLNKNEIYAFNKPKKEKEIAGADLQKPLEVWDPEFIETMHILLQSRYCKTNALEFKDQMMEVANTYLEKALVIEKERLENQGLYTDIIEEEVKEIRPKIDIFDIARKPKVPCSLRPGDWIQYQAPVFRNIDWRRIKEISKSDSEDPVVLENGTRLSQHEAITKLDIDSNGNYIKDSGDKRRINEFDLVHGIDKSIMVRENDRSDDYLPHLKKQKVSDAPVTKTEELASNQNDDDVSSENTDDFFP